MDRRSCLALAALLVEASVLGLHAAVMPAAAAQDAARAVVPTATSPVVGTTIEVRSGSARGRFILDTGGGTTLVSPAFAKAAGCRPWGRQTGFRATGERIDVAHCDGLALEISGTTLRPASAGVFDVNRFLPKGEPPIAGLLALDAFDGMAVTIRPAAHEVVIESAASLLARTRHARPLALRLVRDAQGAALSADGAVPTSAGTTWMELDTGNLGPMLIDRPIAALLGADPARPNRQRVRFRLGDGVVVAGPAKVGEFILDGDIGEDVLGGFDLTLDLATHRAWLIPAKARP